MSRSPEILTGSRGPRGPETVTALRPEEGAFPQVAVREEKAGEVTYVSKFAKYRLSRKQLTKRIQLTVDGGVGVDLNEPRLPYMWENNELTLSDPEDIQYIESLPRYGIGRDYWRKADQLKAMTEKQLSAVEALISQLAPEQQAVVALRLRQTLPEFKLPTLVNQSGSLDESSAEPEDTDGPSDPL